MNKLKKGFTLLELMVAAGVLIVALVGLLSTYITCMELSETTRNSNLALNSAQKVLEDIRSTAFTSIYTNYNGYDFSVSGMPANFSVGHVYIENLSTYLLNVSVGVCWRQKGSRIIGNCTDAGGVVTFSGTQKLDSPVELSVLMTDR